MQPNRIPVVVFALGVLAWSGTAHGVVLAAEPKPDAAATKPKPAKEASPQRPANEPAVSDQTTAAGGPTRLAPPPTGDTTVNRSAPTPPGELRKGLGETTPPLDEATGTSGGPTRLAPPPTSPAGPSTQ